MASDTATHTARWLAALVAMLIVYGSLYPFGFTAPPAAGLPELVSHIGWARTSRADVIANLLLYLPLGALLSFALPPAWSAARTAFVALALGSLLAGVLESLQTLEQHRVASLTDLVLNAIGTFAGAIVALAVRAAGERIGPILGAIDLRAAPVALALVGCWLVTRLAPFEWTGTWRAWRQNLRPLWLDPSLSLATLLGQTAAWSVILVSLRATVRRDAGFVVLGFLVLAVAAGRIAGAGHVLDWPELLALVGVLVAWPLTESLSDRALTLGALGLLALALLVAGLAPEGSFGTLTNAAHEFSLAPLDAKALGTPAHATEAAFTAGALVWLLFRLGGGALRAGLLGSALLLAIEAVQLWMPGRESSLTAPALALVAAAVVALLEPKAG